VSKDLASWNALLIETLVIKTLEVDDWQVWPTPSYSHRIRLLPLLLASAGRVREAREVLRRFALESLGRDQLLPNYATFAAAFEARFAV
jgi:hypothetical protein